MGLKDRIAAVKAKRQANQERRAATPSASGKPASKKGPSEAEKHAAELQAAMDKLRSEQAAFLEQQRQQALAAQREEVVGYLSRAGAKVSPALLAQIAPQVDARTAEGRKALEDFRSSHADIFAPAPRAAGDVSASVVERIDKSSKRKGQTGLEDRKVFGAELVKRTIAKNLGGGEA